MEAEIEKNRSIYRKMFPFKTILKQHILEKHCSPHTKKKTGCAGSDGGEVNREQSPNDFINRKRQGARSQKQSSQITPHINSTFTQGGSSSPKLNCDKYTSPKLNYDNIKDVCVVYGASSKCHSFLYVVLFIYSVIVNS